MMNYSNLDLLCCFAVMLVVAAHFYRQSTAYHLCACDARVYQSPHNLSFTGVMFFFVHICLVLFPSSEARFVSLVHRYRLLMLDPLRGCGQGCEY